MLENIEKMQTDARIKAFFEFLNAKTLDEMCYILSKHQVTEYLFEQYKYKIRCYYHPYYW